MATPTKQQYEKPFCYKISDKYNMYKMCGIKKPVKKQPTEDEKK